MEARGCVGLRSLFLRHFALDTIEKADKLLVGDRLGMCRANADRSSREYLSDQMPVPKTGATLTCIKVAPLLILSLENLPRFSESLTRIYRVE